MLELFAQANKFPRNNPPPPDPAAEAAAGGIMAGICGVYILIILFYILMIISAIIGLVFFILLLVTMSKSLELTRKKYRQMEPGMVWLSLIPIFGPIWLIISVIRVSDGLMKTYHYYDARPPIPECGKGFGILAVCLAIFLGCIPFLGPVMFYKYTNKLKKVNEGLTKAIKAARRAEREEREELEEQSDDEE